MEEVVDLLQQYFSGVKFSFEYDKQLKKFMIICDDYKTYFSEHMKEVMKVITDHYNDLKFFMVYQNKKC